jgi:predicted transcriptional regulator
MTAEYKKAETLGTLDAGVLALMSQIVGEEPTSTFNLLTNVTGRKSKQLSSQIGTFIENITVNQARDKARLGIEPTVDFTVISDEDNMEIDSLMGVNTTTSQQGGFNPNSYYK